MNANWLEQETKDHLWRHYSVTEAIINQHTAQNQFFDIMGSEVISILIIQVTLN
jgi:hypothetical protein